MKKIALIPAYEPDEKLIKLVRKLAENDFEIVIVDDGSGFGYKEIFDETANHARVISYSKNKGKGHALKVGFEYIEQNFDRDSIIITMDSDGQHTIADAEKVFRCAKNNRNALILGSRKLKDKVPARSQFGNTVTRFIYKLTTGVAVYDTQTGLRAFDWDMMRRLSEISGERYEYEMNVLLECPKMKIPIIETEIETIYFDNNSGSHFNTIKDSARIYKEILKFSASSLLGFVVDYLLFSLLIAFTGVTAFSNIAARLVSATVNFSVNRKIVFKSKENLVKSAVQYFALAGVILAGNTCVLKLLTSAAGINPYVAKIITEILFFFVSWIVQRTIIFKKDSGRKGVDRKCTRKIVSGL